MPYLDQSSMSLASLSRLTPTGQQPRQAAAAKAPMPAKAPALPPAVQDDAKPLRPPAAPRHPWALRRYNLMTWAPDPTAVTRAIAGNQYVKDYTDNAFARK